MQRNPRHVCVSVQSDDTCRTEKPHVSTCYIHAVQRNLRLVRVSAQSDHTGHTEKPQVTPCIGAV